MKRVKLFASALAFIAASISGAYAADLDQVIPATQEDAYTPVEIGSGWYIRGDISYDIASSTSGSYRTYGQISAGPPPVYAYGAASYDNFDINRTTSIDLGFGYRFNSYLRTDITLGNSKHSVNGTDTDPAPCVDPLLFPTAVSCRSEDKTSATSWDLMANVYGDFGTYHGLTPYLGAGVGFANIKYGALTNKAFCVDAAGADIAGCGYSGVHEGASTWRPSWALMAGASYDLSKSLKLDVGYRYTHIAGGDMFNFDPATAALGATGIQGKDKGFSTNQIKVGLRYEIW
jgi:opacity protein-like surface antigen